MFQIDTNRSKMVAVTVLSSDERMCGLPKLTFSIVDKYHNNSRILSVQKWRRDLYRVHFETVRPNFFWKCCRLQRNCVL